MAHLGLQRTLRRRIQVRVCLELDGKSISATPAFDAPATGANGLTGTLSLSDNNEAILVARRSPRSYSSRNALPESQVRSRLFAGGRWIRTSGSPTDPPRFRESGHFSHDGLTVSRPGTGSSNPSPSSGESDANLASARVPGCLRTGQQASSPALCSCNSPMPNRSHRDLIAVAAPTH